MERLEVALRAKTAHGGSMQKGEKISQKDSGSYVDSNGVGREIKGKGVSGKEQGKIRDGDVLILNLEYYVTTTRAHKLFSTNSSGTPDFSKWTISHVLNLAHDRKILTPAEAIPNKECFFQRNARKQLVTDSVAKCRPWRSQVPLYPQHP